jgi:hypothetical protein
MYKHLIIITSLFLLILISGINAQLTIGVSPPVLYLGDIEPGSSKIARFKLLSTSSEVILTYLTPRYGNLDWFSTSDYKDYISNFSEQDVTSWVELTKNPVEVEETTGGTIKGASEVTFILRVPEDAEPGYHMGMINLDPVGPTERGMFNIKATVPLVFIFKTPGCAVRNARIIDAVPGDYSEGYLKLTMFIQNTGTVTLQSFINNIDIFDKDGEKITSFSGGGNSIAPSEIGTFNFLWAVNDVDKGSYDASVKFDYSTGLTHKNTTIEVTKVPIIPTPKVVEEVYVFPFWILIALIVIFIIAYFIYRT